MKWPLVKFEEKEEKPEKMPKTKDPWLLKAVENGLKAVNIRELTGTVRANRKFPVQYFEDDRIYGNGAFDSPMKVMDMFDELKSITPKTKGFIFWPHRYLYHNKGILKEHIETGKESFFSRETLRNEAVSCYLSLVYSQEEDRILEIINELDNAITTEPSKTDQDRRRIQG